MIILDTDHINVLQTPRDAAVTLSANMASSSDQDFATSVITVEEQMRGWLAYIHRNHDVHRQLPGYERLVRLFTFFSRWKVVQFEDKAADEFKRLRSQKVRIGTMDLKIAAVALVNDALLLSANLRDFQPVPDLRTQNWLV